MWKKILVGLIVGFISGMFASGGGLLLIPAYIHFFDSSEKRGESHSYILYIANGACYGNILWNW